MKINLNYKFKALNGVFITQKVDIGKKDEDGKPIMKDEPLTLGKACAVALLGNFPGELSGDEKVKRYSLAMDIHKAKNSIDLTVEDVSLIKELIAKVYSVLVTGQAWQILDPVKKN